MEVILLERIEKLGQMGDVVDVKPGYARNFLLPRKKALRATEDNRLRFKEQRTQLEAVNLERRGEAEKVSAKLDGLSVALIRQAGEAGQLYGSVTVRDVAKEVTDAGFTVERGQIQLAHPIKALGVYGVRVDLHPEVSMMVTVNVARSEEEAAIQARTGRAVVRLEEEEEARPAPHKAKPREEEARAAEGDAPAPEKFFEEIPEELVDKPHDEPSPAAGGKPPADAPEAEDTGKP